jgi:Protein of unknown function, DUF255
MATEKTIQLNRLATAKSPYLRQHATNPVDWFPFEKAALDKAKAENKVYLYHLCELSIYRSYFYPLGIVHVTGSTYPSLR